MISCTMIKTCVAFGLWVYCFLLIIIILLNYHVAPCRSYDDDVYF